MKTQLLRILALAMLFSLVGCTPRSTLSINLQAHEELNQTATGDSLPVMVRLYQLSATEAFQQANFQGLWKKDTDVLGETLIQKKEIQLSPNEKRLLKWKQQELANYIGVVAIFRDPSGHHKTIKSIHQRVPGWPQQEQLVLSGNDLRFHHE